MTLDLCADSLCQIFYLDRPARVSRYNNSTSTLKHFSFLTTGQCSWERPWTTDTTADGDTMAWTQDYAGGDSSDGTSGRNNRAHIYNTPNTNISSSDFRWQRMESGTMWQGPFYYLSFFLIFSCSDAVIGAGHPPEDSGRRHHQHRPTGVLWTDVGYLASSWGLLGQRP